VPKVGQNLKFDAHVLRRHGMPVAGWSLDTMVAAFLLDPDRASFSMDSLAAYYLRHETIKYASLVGTGAKQLTLDRVDVDSRHAVRREDADVTLRLAGVLEPRLAEAKVEEVWRTIDAPVLPILLEMEAAGIRWTSRPSRRCPRRWRRPSPRRGATSTRSPAGRSTSIRRSSSARSCSAPWALRPGKKTAKSGEYSTDATTLEELATEHEIARRLSTTGSSRS
jgi:DNA polymerase-1